MQDIWNHILPSAWSKQYRQLFPPALQLTKLPPSHVGQQLIHRERVTNIVNVPLLATVHSEAHWIDRSDHRIKPCNDHQVALRQLEDFRTNFPIRIRTCFDLARWCGQKPGTNWSHQFAHDLVETMEHVDHDASERFRMEKPRFNRPIEVCWNDSVSGSISTFLASTSFRRVRKSGHRRSIAQCKQSSGGVMLGRFETVTPVWVVYQRADEYDPWHELLWKAHWADDRKENWTSWHLSFLNSQISSLGNVALWQGWFHHVPASCSSWRLQLETTIALISPLPNSNNN